MLNEPRRSLVNNRNPRANNKVTTKAIQSRVPQKAIERVSTNEVDNFRQFRHVRHCAGCGSILFAVPVIACGCCGKEMNIRCFTYKSGGYHYAECLNFNLLSRGASEEEAVARLQETMYSYVKTAFQGDIKGLIPRRAPVSHWVKYYVYSFAEWLRYRLLKGHIRHRNFEEVETIRFQHCGS